MLKAGEAIWYWCPVCRQHYTREGVLWKGSPRCKVHPHVPVAGKVVKV
jgi:hypothetical protein